MNYSGVLGRAVRNQLRNSIIRRCEYSTTVTGILRSPYGKMAMPKGRVHECMYERMDKHGARVAVECSMTGRKYTFAEMRKFSGILAAAMQNKLKLQKGDTIAMFLHNIPEYPMIFLAGSESGVALTTVNSSYTTGEVARQLEVSNAKAIFTTIDKFSTAEAALESMKKKLPIVVIKEKPDETIPPGGANFAEFLDASTCGQVRPVDSTENDVFVLPFSSGTTGLPKGVELLHRNILANTAQVEDGKLRLIEEDLEEDIVLGLLPMYHIYGMTVLSLTSLYTGAFLVTMPRFDPVHYIETIIRKKIMTLYLVPPLVLFMTNAPFVTKEALKSVKYITIGAAPIGEKDVLKFLEKKKDILIGQGYGLTETSPLVLMHTRERFKKYGSCGVPVISTEIRIVDGETSKPVGVNEQGELWVKGPQVMNGYYQNKKATDEIFVDGWLRTGDIACYDDEGDFFICDRIKDLIKVKGFQVPPSELEELLRTNPKVIDAAVIGMQHPTKGEVPKAFVVLRKGETATADEVKDFVKGKVAKYKELEGGVAFVEALPRSTSGKILKKELLALAKD